jgi:glycosyltransferase involved in cell wall biosynthesis
VGAVGSPRVSVVVPVYNRVAFLREAIESVLAQTYRDLELVLIDDGSTEPGVADVLAGYREDPRVRIEHNARNQGIARVHNQSLDLVRGEYVAALDSDDVALPRRVARQVEFLDAHPGFALVGSWTRATDAAGAVGWRVRRYPSDPDAARAWLLFRCYVNHPSTLGRTAVLRAYRYCEDLALSNDYELFVRLARDHRVASLPEVLTLNRKHGARATRDRERRKRENLRVIEPQLAELGVGYDARDLERHFAITRRSSWLVPDAEYLEWAAGWLSSLSDANRRTARFAEPAFGRVLAQVWRELCWRALPRIGWRALARYWRARFAVESWRDSPARPGVRPPVI